MATTTAAFSHLLAPGLRKVFFDEYKTWPEEYSKIATVESSSRAYEEELITAGLGRFERKPEGMSLIYDDPIQGDKKRYTHVTFALGFRVSREMWQDDQYTIMKKMSKELAMSARQTVELEFGSMVDDAFVGGTHLGADGKALCATDHPLLVGGTYQNRPTVHTDLGVGALRSSLERIELMVSERGLPIMTFGSTVIVSPTFQWVAKEMLSAKTEFAPYTDENQINAFRDMNLGYMVYHFMSDSDMWFTLAQKSEHDMKFFWRQKPLFENGDDFDTKDAKFSGFMRFSYGFTDWRGVDGSSGG
jgi:hypothetical protein